VDNIGKNAYNIDMILFKKIVKSTLMAILALLLVLIVFVGGLTTWHHTLLTIERGQLDNPGNFVSVDGNSMNVYASGESQENIATLVFISGAGTSAPIYSFMPLINRLQNYRIVVVERFGYGYSNIVKNLKRDIATMLDNTRQALKESNIRLENLILLPHSMGGLEALYWISQYPDEVLGVVGLDMANPGSYDSIDFESEKSQIMLAKKLKFFGLSRVLENGDGTTDLTNNQIKQQKILSHRNFVNPSLVDEGLALLNNVEVVRQTMVKKGNFELPMLLFSSNGKEIDEHWVPSQRSFAEQSENRKLIELDVCHYIFQYKAEQIAQEINSFVGGLV
jgi:pimeloyl-ACP methyl ester carboxylesterase